MEKGKEVSIIIPTLNKGDLLAQCLVNLMPSIEGIDAEVIVVDVGSTEQQTKDFLNNIGKQVTVMTLGSVTPFAKANNSAAKVARGRFLLFLNNDTIPTKGFLTEMLALRKKLVFNKCKIVGSKLLFPNSNIVQHVGVIIRPDGLPTHIHYQKSLDDVSVLRDASEVRSCVAVTAACMLIDNLTFRELGGYDERYINGFEDIDLCFKAKEKGYRSYYCPTSLVYHIEHGTIGAVPEQAEFQGNCQQFLNNWSQKLNIVGVL